MSIFGNKWYVVKHNESVHENSQGFGSYTVLLGLEHTDAVKSLLADACAACGRTFS